MASSTGRATHPLSTRTGPAAKTCSRVHPNVFRSMKGRVWKRFSAGRSSWSTSSVGPAAWPRPVMLMRVERCEQFVVWGSNGGNPAVPNWYRNLLAAGEADGARRHCTFTGVADGPERDECRDLLVAAYPDVAGSQKLSERRLPLGPLSPE